MKFFSMCDELPGGYSLLGGGTHNQKAVPQSVEKNYLVDLAEKLSKVRSRIEDRRKPKA
jgi:hypothetical protein